MSEQEIDKDTLIRIKRAKIKLQKDKPFFSDLLFFLKIKQDDKLVDSAGVNIKGDLFYNAKWISALTDEQIKGVLVHEVLHLALLHITRGMKADEKLLWNLAIDCHANFIARKNGFQLPEVGCVPDTYRDEVNIKDSSGNTIYKVEKVEEKTSEEIYFELRNSKKFPKQQTIYICDGGGKDGKGKLKIQGFDSHMSEGMSKEEAQRSENEWKQRVINADTRAKNVGQSPAGMKRIIDSMLEPQVPWREKLYKFITDDLPQDFTWRKPHKRSQALGWYIPSYLKESLNVAVFVDTSGSIGGEELREFISEAYGISKAFESITMKFGFVDAKVQKVYDVNECSREDLISFKAKGGGGTDMRTIFSWLDENDKNTNTIVIFTDGWTPWIKPEDVKGRNILWVISSNGIEENRFPEGIGEFIPLKSR